MRHLTVIAILIAALVCSGTAQAQNIVNRGLADTWHGEFATPGGTLHLVVNITGANGAFSGAMDSPDQGVRGVKFDSVTLQGNKVHLALNAAGASFDGDWNRTTDEISGRWSQSGTSLPLTLKRGGIEKPKRPQEPTPPYPYNAEEVRYTAPSGGNTIAGTLTSPRSRGPFPAVLLLVGSGPNNRDEAIYGHRPFLVLADYLTRRGMAVLRVDKRGIGQSTGDITKATIKDFAEDAVAGIQYLRTRAEVDKTKIGLIGHSEGGVIAPLVASHSKDVAFIVMMAGDGLPGIDILKSQTASIGRAMGMSAEAIAKNTALQARILAIASEETNPIAAESRLRAVFDEATFGMTNQEKKQAGDLDKVRDARIATLMSPWMHLFLTYDPRPTLRKVSCPVLAIGGSKDMQIAAKENLPEIRAALTAGGNKDFTVTELPGLNHLFQTAKSGAPMEYETIEETISPVALNAIGDWIAARTGLPPRR